MLPRDLVNIIIGYLPCNCCNDSIIRLTSCTECCDIYCESCLIEVQESETLKMCKRCYYMWPCDKNTGKIRKFKSF